MRSERPNHLLQLCCLIHRSDKIMTNRGIEKEYIEENGILAALSHPRGRSHAKYSNESRRLPKGLGAALGSPFGRAVTEGD